MSHRCGVLCRFFNKVGDELVSVIFKGSNIGGGGGPTTKKDKGHLAIFPAA